MIGIRPSIRRKMKWTSNGNLSDIITPNHPDSGNTPVFGVSLGSIRSTHDKYADTWEKKNGKKYATRVRKKRGAIKTIIAPKESNGRGELMDFLDYGEISKIVFETPRIFDQGAIGVEPFGDCIKVTAPGFSTEIPTTGQSLKSWNYTNGVIEINLRRSEH